MCWRVAAKFVSCKLKRKRALVTHPWLALRKEKFKNENNTFSFVRGKILQESFKTFRSCGRQKIIFIVCVICCLERYIFKHSIFYAHLCLIKLSVFFVVDVVQYLVFVIWEFFPLGNNNRLCHRDIIHLCTIHVQKTIPSVWLQFLPAGGGRKHRDVSLLNVKLNPRFLYSHFKSPRKWNTCYQ